MDDFSGSVSMVGVNFAGRFKLSARSNKSSLLTLGMQSNVATYVPKGLPLVAVGDLLNEYYASGAVPIASVNTQPTKAWIRKMLGQIRTEYGVPLVSGQSFSDRVRLERVGVHRLANAMTIVPAFRTAGLYYTLENKGQRLQTDHVSGSCLTMDSSGSLDARQQWLLTDGGEGDFVISRAGMNEGTVSAAGNGLATAAIGPESDEHWRVVPSGTGEYQIISSTSAMAIAAPDKGTACASLSKDLTSGLTMFRLVAH